MPSITSCSHGSHKKCAHFSFRDFLDSGGDESTSPFLKPQARKMSKWLDLPLALFSGLLLAIAFAAHLGFSTPVWSYCLIALVFFLSGTKALYGAAQDLALLQLNIDILMTLAAYLCAFMGSYLEGALLLVLFDISRNMEKLVNQRARSSVMSLRDIAPEKVLVINSDRSETIYHIHDVRVGMRILVKAAEVVPLDGIVCHGSSSVSFAHLTGESAPHRVKPGDAVASGAKTIDGALELEVSKPIQEATLTQIIKLIHEAHEAKPALERTFDKLGDRYAQIIIAASLLIALISPLGSSLDYLGEDGSIYRALTFLIAASPCALILALPIAYLSALGACARKGIILKGGAIFDRLYQCKALAFDKTGTLTQGALVVSHVQTFGKITSSFEQAVANLEKRSSHPLAESLCRYYKSQIQHQHLESIHIDAGQGMSADYEGKLLRVGHSQYALENAPEHLRALVQSAADELKKTGATYCVASDGEQAIMYIFLDQLRDQAAQTISALKNQLAMKSYMLTGDHRQSAHEIAKQVGVDEVFYELSPEQKVDMVEKLSIKGSLAMVGDGVNDAPALARATVGIAMGNIGSGAATYAADVLLLNDDISQLPWLFHKARQVRTIIWQNLALAGCAIVLATSSALLGALPLWAAVIAHEGGTILVGLNGLRLMRTKS